MKLKFFVFLIIIIMLGVGCNDSQSMDGVDLYSEISNSEEIGEESEMPDDGIVTEQHQGLSTGGWWEEYLEQRDKANVDHILRGPYTPADRDIDLHRIERFVFENCGGEHGGYGYGFVLDKMYGRVYFNPSTPAVHMLEFIRFSAEFKEEDLERLIKAIEDSGLRDWEYSYEGVRGVGSVGWRIGILFDDGTMMRRRGFGITEENPTLHQQYNMLIGFIEEIGAEIEARHNAEQEANP